MRTRAFLALAVISTVVLTACSGSSGGTKVPPSNPIFTSAPVTAAAQGTPYSYTLAATDPARGTVTFALTTSPTGAAISGSAVNWTPTASQSRTSNSFTATATTTSGGTATQSWTVSPTGIVTVTWINAYWEPGGPVQVPVTSADSLEISAVVPQADGSLIVLKGATTSPGVITIAGVPEGNYWLAIGGTNLLPDATSAYWTDTTTFDIGRDIAGSPEPTTTSTGTTQLILNLSGMESVNAPTNVIFNTASRIVFNQIDQSNTSTASLQTGLIGPFDWSQVHNGFLAQYLPSTVGAYAVNVIGPSATLSNLSLINGTTNTITQALQAESPVSLDVSVQGSQWVSSFTGASSATPTPYGSAFSVEVEPFVIGTNTPASLNPQSSLLLAGTDTPPFGIVPTFPQFPNCNAGFVVVSPVTLQPPVLTDQDLGTLQYNDPFSSTWTRAESFCEEALVPVSIPNSSSTANFALVNSATTVPPSSALAPIVGIVQSPTVNSGSLYAAATLTTTTPTLSWSAPATGSPYGYRISAFVLSNASSLPAYVAAGVFYSAQSSVTLPPLSAGNTYVFSITALVDGTANIQASPFRSSLPTGYASIVSAPMTISSGAASAVIHGDATVIRRFSQPTARRNENVPFRP